MLYRLLLHKVCITKYIKNKNYHWAGISATMAILMIMCLGPKGSAQRYGNGYELLESISTKKNLRIDDIKLYKSVRNLSRTNCSHHLRKDRQFYTLVGLLDENSLLSSTNNKVELLLNGEEKFPRLLEDLEKAKDHIHFQYYIYDVTGIGEKIAAVLKRKARAGVEVRFLYDAFGSKLIRPRFLRELRDAGVEVSSYLGFDMRYPFMSLNNRNHRKIVVIDGEVSYLGGLNIADRYINEDSTRSTNPYYWRDTHIRIEGTATHALQYIFMGDWNFATEVDLGVNPRYFPPQCFEKEYGNCFIQTLSSGPEDEDPLLLNALEEAIKATKKELLFVTPYFIPNAQLMKTLVNASKKGIDVQMIIPGMTDALMVNSVARSYYRRLLKNGVKIWEYHKGFVHAKTILCDEKLAMLGSANIDRRSFFLNMEACTFVFDKEFSKKCRASFMEDRRHSTALNIEDWDSRSLKEKVYENSLRIFAPLF